MQNHANPRQFWRYVNSQLKVHPKMDSLKDSDNMVAYLDSEKSELLNSYFSSILTNEDLSYIPSFKLNFDINLLASYSHRN